MKPNSLTVFELFERQQRYIVPLFQRPYVWVQEKQWQPLWEDISQKADEILAGKHGASHTINNHFLGAIVLNPIMTRGLEVSAKSIIDGQQRITTLQIILIAMRDLCNWINYNDLLPTLDLHTENQCRLDKKSERFKVWPTNADREMFENVFGAGSPEKLRELYPPKFKRYARHPDPLPLLVSAYLFFYEQIQAYVQQQPLPEDEQYTKEEKLEALVQAFKRYLEIVTIDLEDKDNPQIIFESLNYRGEPLTPSDLIRNFVFLEANRNALPIEDLYHDFWYEYDRPASNGNTGFWKQTEKQGRLNRQRLDLFVFHYLVYKTGREIAITRLYPEFKEWWESQKRTVHAELQEMQKYSRIFQQFYAPNVSTRIGIVERRLRMLDVSTVYPLLLFVLGDCSEYLPAAELEGIFVDIESFLMRRMVCGLTTKNYNSLFLGLLNKLRKSGTVVSRAEVRRLLTEGRGESVRFPDDKEFEQSWMGLDAYHNLRHRTKIVLEAVDLQLTTSKQEEVHLGGSLTLEHLMPQQWQEANYPLPVPQGDETRETMVNRRAGLIHTFGNLTLLTQALNSAISNGAFDAKLAEIRRHSLLRINGEFLKPKTSGQWSEKDIDARGKELFKIAQKLWAFPS